MWENQNNGVNVSEGVVTGVPIVSSEGQRSGLGWRNGRTAVSGQPHYNVGTRPTFFSSFHNRLAGLSDVAITKTWWLTFSTTLYAYIYRVDYKL